MASINDEFIPPNPALGEFYKNPGGKGSSTIGLNDMRVRYIERYDYVVKKLKKPIEVTSYYENDQSIYLHVIVPSDLRACSYDVVFHVFDPTGKAGGNITKWQFQVFSNCPSNVYTYAYVYEMNQLMIPELKSKLNRKVFAGAPLERNPDLLLRWDKSVFYALHKIMNTITLKERFAIKRNSKEFNMGFLKRKVRTEDQIMLEYAQGKMQKVLEVEMKESAISKLTGRAGQAMHDAANGLLEKTTGKRKPALDKHPRRDAKGRIVSQFKITGRGHRIKPKRKF